MKSNDGLNLKIIEQSNCIRISNNGVLIDLEVSPSSNRPGIKGYNRWRDRILINIRSPARKGQANKELLKMFADYFEITNDDIRIVNGHHSELKTIEISSIDQKTIITRLIEEFNE